MAWPQDHLVFSENAGTPAKSIDQSSSFVLSWPCVVIPPTFSDKPISLIWQWIHLPVVPTLLLRLQLLCQMMSHVYRRFTCFPVFSIIFRRLLSTMPWTSFGSFCRKSPTFSSTRQSSSHLGSVNLGHVSKVVAHVRLGTSEWDCVVNKDQRNAIPTWGRILRIWSWCHFLFDRPKWGFEVASPARNYLLLVTINEHQIVFPRALKSWRSRMCSIIKNITNWSSYTIQQNSSGKSMGFPVWTSTNGGFSIDGLFPGGYPISWSNLEVLCEKLDALSAGNWEQLGQQLWEMSVSRKTGWATHGSYVSPFYVRYWEINSQKICGW